jgi:iron(III) transport system ATP-binding protein
VSPAPAAIRLRGVVRAYGARRVLDGIDLDVPAGSLSVLLGRSGAGKSTLLRLVAGLDDPDAGRVEVGGVVVADPRSRVPAERRGVGMVFQSLELWPHMTAAENVAFGLAGRPRGARAATHPRVLEVAEQVGLSRDLLARRPPTLSGGERQRVAIARALAPDPAVVLYDEPLANLDPERRAEVRRLLRALRARGGATVLYVTHDAAEALEMGDAVAVLDGGRVVDRGAPNDLYRSPRTVAGARALGPVTVLPAREGPRGLETDLGVLPRPPGGDGPAGRGVVAAVGLRPEQIAPVEGGGVAAEVVDAYPCGADWAFSARLSGSGAVVSGRSRAALSVGSVVRLASSGAPIAFPSAPVPGAAEGAA